MAELLWASMTNGYLETHPALSPAIRALGFAGLAPQGAAVLVQLWAAVSGQDGGATLAAYASLTALVYGAVILSFLGGIWWGLALRRTDGQAALAALAALAVLPSLVAVGLIGAAAIIGVRWALVALGSAIVLTLLVDRRLVITGEAPRGWMGLRTPLSAGLGALTIVAGVLATR